LLPKEAQDPLAQAIALVAEHGRPSALTHRLSRTDPYPVAHHIRRDPVTQMLQGLIELPLTELGATAAAARDPLTGLGSASVARHALAVPNTVTQHVLLVGLARFEMINGAFGRMTGDAVLRALARRMTRALEAFSIPPPLAARIAGTTFLVLLAGDRAAGQVSLLAHDLAIALERPVIAEGHEVHVGCWIAAVERLADEDGPAVLRRASEALAEARASGASNIRLSKARGGPGQSIARPPSLPTELRTALDRNEIDILFQPQVAISTSEIVGVEALARWTHPVQGMLGAATLFAVAERSDYLGALSAHIQKRAAEQAARWPAALNRLRLSVNVTAQDIARSGFADGFLRMLDASGFPRDRLTLEITENGLIDNLAQAADLLAELRKAGCRVAIDDFGTGYSSLAYLKALPLDYLKIDKALAQDIIGTARDRVVVRGVIDMARSLGLAVIAEGVETEEQRAALAEQGANYYQGFLCAEPLDVLALETLVTSR
jgi:diguanylate cyclase (GGDEF)-like protein